MSNLLHRAGTPYPRAIAVAARTMSTTRRAWTKLIRAKRQPHLRPEKVVVEIVHGTFLVPPERPDEASTDPEQCGDAPPGIGVEDAPQRGDVERRLQRATSSPHGAESDTEREQMNGGQ